ncbi:hypothetical protein CHGG_02873 [Chaetomium globosum CBS 148.51]|uniref:Glutathione synthetase n=1 Tax=Chaetomium globosum (strain ATCC 6205 / CBS 148.51 / DSM 1962 / NBRC 6347 / NRRL 1970) TaxID=306901 RepID=Q2HA81_CHAGB|nr:uncharacterized protein CHGG_02873 [Chaetomium globosum CBS 148.51]EAQ90938.1 hypothetical protein CHGG_02873 [Chaetomium globosum CBS 148.51]
MSSLTGGSYPPTLDDALEKDRLAQAIKDWTIANGLAVRPPPAVASNNLEGILAMSAPVTLFPSPFPKSCFEEAKAIQTKYNELYARISQDEEYLSGLVQEVASGDEFIAELWKIHLRVKEEGYVQNLALGLFRSDYMVHQDGDNLQIKQVEFNTIASSFGGLSAQTSLLHQYETPNKPLEPEIALTLARHLVKNEYPLLQNSISRSSVDLPANNSAEGLAAGLAAAFCAYGQSTLGHPTCVLFITQDGERNVFDQRHLEYALQSSSTTPDPIPVFRLPFSQLLTHTTLAPSSPTRQLLYHPPHNPTLTFEVAVAYLRAAYGPSDFPTPTAWESRYQLERSAAIKCPTILTQLAGMKIVQQVLGTPEGVSTTLSALRCFVPNDDVAYSVFGASSPTSTRWTRRSRSRRRGGWRPIPTPASATS